MTPEEKENALRAQARRCAEELTKAMSAKPKPKWNAVCPPHPSQALREGPADGRQSGEICQCYWPHARPLWSGIMSKVTFVVDFEDGKEPAVHSRMNILGGELAAVAWRDSLKSNVVSVGDYLPAANQQVLLFDANGEGWVIGWRSVWLSEGMKETGDWEWSYQIDSLDDEEMNITHWAPTPSEPGAE